jgi:hypothetical protein
MSHKRIETHARRRPLRTLLVTAGVLWGSAYFVMNAIGWGEPGSVAYQRYELFNRILGVVLLLLTATTWMLRSALRPIAPRFVRRALALTAAAQAMMVLGSVLEFWVFTLTPYAAGSLRGVGWTVYCLGLASFYGAGACFGWSLARSRASRAAGVAFLVWLPIAGLLFALGNATGWRIPALAPAVAVSGLGYVLVATHWKRIAAASPSDSHT